MPKEIAYIKISYKSILGVTIKYEIGYSRTERSFEPYKPCNVEYRHIAKRHPEGSSSKDAESLRVQSDHNEK